MTAVEVKGRDTKITWEIVCIYSSKRGYAVVRKTGRPDRIFGK
jgi:hypothetical protein